MVIWLYIEIEKTKTWFTSIMFKESNSNTNIENVESWTILYLYSKKPFWILDQQQRYKFVRGPSYDFI